MLIIGAIIGAAVTALTYAGETVVDRKIQQKKAEKMIADAITTRFTEDDDDDDDIFCEECFDEDVDDEHNPSKVFNDDPLFTGEEDELIKELTRLADEEIDVDLSSTDEPETVDVPEEKIESVPEESSVPVTETDEGFHQGQNVKFKGDEARTWNGNKIAGGVYKFIKYDEKTPTICLITKGRNKKQFKVIVGALEPA